MSKKTLQKIEGQAAVVASMTEKYTELVEEELYRSDGEPKFSPMEMKEQRQNIQDAAINQIEKAMDKVAKYAKRAERWRQKAAAWDPLDEVSFNLKKARNMAPFVREDCQTLPLTTLVARGRALFGRKGDLLETAKGFLYYRYLSQRIAEMESNGTNEPGMREAAELLERLSGALGGDKAARLERKADRLEKAIQEFELDAESAKRQILRDSSQSADEAVRKMF